MIFNRIGMFSLTKLLHSHSRFNMTFVFATHNPHKVREIRALIPKWIELRSLADIRFTAPIAETADDLEGNARIKAQTIFDSCGIPCFADDTGLFVDALDGAPGVHSARYAGDHAVAGDNIKKLLAALSDHSDRKAHFRTVIAFVDRSGVRYFEGRIDGSITREPGGGEGFGYDPIFIPEGYDITFAEMPPATKNEISHRALAFRSFDTYLKKMKIG